MKSLKAQEEKVSAQTPRIVVLSGPVGSGKSTLAARLRQRYGAYHLRTQELIKQAAARSGDTLVEERRALQDYGDKLDEETAYRWIAKGVGDRIEEGVVNSSLIVVDVQTLLRTRPSGEHSYWGATQTFPLTPNVPPRAM